MDGCVNGVLPVSGGLMDQSVYYFELSSRLRSERSKIHHEQVERNRKK